jgi:hypothetical protein
MLRRRLAGPEWQPGLVIGNTAHQATSHQNQPSYVLLLLEIVVPKVTYIFRSPAAACLQRRAP